MNLRSIMSSFACALFLALAAAAESLPAEGVTPINNREYAPAVQKLLQKAHKSLWLMLYQTRYYEEYPNTITNFYVKDLIAAKQRGLDVRMLVDTGDWNPSQKNEYNTDYMQRLTTSGIEMWEDSPQEVSHQKVIVVDDDITVVSSNNWTYYSLANNNEVAVVIYSPQVNAYFRSYFAERQKNGKPFANANQQTSQSAVAITNSLTGAELPELRQYPVADVQPIPNRVFYPTVHDAFLSATKSIDVVQRSINLSSSKPFSDGPALPGEPPSEVNVLVDDLIAAQKRGVKVRVILDKNENFDDAQNSEAAQYMKERGLQVLQDDEKVQTHAKMVRIDDDKTIVGSTNWTYSAIEEGNEASVLITSPELNKVYRDYVENLLLSAQPYQAKSKSIWDAPTTPPKQAESKE